MPDVDFCHVFQFFVSARSSRVSPSADVAGFPAPVPGFRASYRGVWQNRRRRTKRRWSVCSDGTTVPGLGSPGCASLPPGGPGSYHGPAAGSCSTTAAIVLLSSMIVQVPAALSVEPVVTSAHLAGPAVV